MEVKDYYEVNGCSVVENARVYNLAEAVRCSKFPMAIDVDKCTSEIVNRTIGLGNAKQGSGHDSYLKSILVSFDLTFTRKAVEQLMRYHWIDFGSSQSQMHKLVKMNISNQYINHVDPRMISLMKEIINEYNENPTKENYLRAIYSNPNGFLLTAHITTNYMQLKTIYNQRCKVPHKLEEWNLFGEWMIRELPYFNELCIGGRE